MKLYTQVILLAVTLFSVTAVPRTGLETTLFRMVLGGEVEPRALTPAAQTCANNYLNATQKNGDILANSTNACEEAANRTKVAYVQSSNTTVNQIRAQLLSLEQNLQLCRNETDSARFLNCTVSTFDQNLQLLDTSNSQAYTAQTQFNSNETQVSAARTNCISAAVSEAKVQSIQIANDFDTCLAKISEQRDMIQVEQKPQPFLPAQISKEQVPEKHQQELEDMSLTN
ncbi:uncharacterized protein LOC110177920 [Drosophila serrata]|uniref:uncharacterized protein LOC110177920 n=1 Tax=Drosophila serrata TaxID=7274 RepID=UPI000A1D205F|nr:uncharacterized protein LOC110177920 [Drosophila serrata]